jgi:ornithine carbamoyltransferase
MASWSGRDFLAEQNHSATELQDLLEHAAWLKSRRRGPEAVQIRMRLAGRQLALILEKTSTRTRLAFEVAMRELGGQISVLDGATSQIGHKESIADTARVLSGMVDAIAYRGSSQQDLTELADFADVPVYNALTDEWHPTQMLADFLTMNEVVPGPPRYAFVGDARSNMGHSLLMMGAIMGADVRIIAPQELWPQAHIRRAAQDRADGSGATVLITEDPADGLADVDFVHTDVWVSMGEDRQVWDQRVTALRPYRVDSALMALTGKPETRFMHCLPAYHDQQTAIGRQIAEEFGLTDGVEVSDEVFESPNSIVFQQAENRLHTIKALLDRTLGD